MEGNGTLAARCGNNKDLFVRMASTAPVMVGGARFQQAVLDWTQQSNSLYLTVFIAVLIIWAVYAEKLPPEWRWQLSTTIGRLLLLLMLYLVFTIAGWLPALLFAIAIALTWSNRPLWKPVGVPEEGFSSGEREGFSNMKKSDVETDRWFVEKTLGERPKHIVEDRVETMAAQDDSVVGSSRTSR